MVHLTLRDVNDNAPQMPSKSVYEIDENANEVDLNFRLHSSEKLSFLRYRTWYWMNNFMLLTKTIRTPPTLKFCMKSYQSSQVRQMVFPILMVEQINHDKINFS